MKLRYRGTEYDCNPPVLEVTESEMTGMYRGRPTHFSYVRHVPIPQVEAELSYRGVTYRTTSSGRIEQTSNVPTESLLTKLKAHMPTNPMTEARRALLREATRVHRDNIQRSLQHRLDVARSQGNELLIRQLEDEMHQLA